MKNMNFVLLGIVTALSLNSFAGTSSGGGEGPLGTLVRCSGTLNNGTNVNLEIRNTAAPTIRDAIIVATKSNQLVAHVYCEGGKAAPTMWSCGNTDWDKAAQNASRSFLINVTTGFTGAKEAHVLLKQTPPSPAKDLGTLSCQQPLTQVSLGGADRGTVSDAYRN